MVESLYTYVWKTSGRQQIKMILIIAVITPLSMVPLELQRRMVDHVTGSGNVGLLVLLGSIYLGVVLIQGGIKYFLNLTKGRALEEVARDLRLRVIRRLGSSTAIDNPSYSGQLNEGTTASMLAAESESVAGFAAESIATPLLQIGTAAWVMGYLIWVEPLIAALAVLVYAPQAILVPRIQRAINRLSRRRTSIVRKLGHLAVTFHSSLRARGEGNHTKRAGVLIEQIFRIRMHIYHRKYLLTFLGNFLDSLGPVVVLVAGGYLVIHGRTEVSTLVVFISGFQKLSDPWDQLVTFYRSVSGAKVTYGLVAEALTDTQSTAAEVR